MLKSAPLIAGAIISTNAVAQNLFAQAKLTLEAANIRTIQKMGSNVRAASSFGASFLQGGGGSGRCKRMVPNCKPA